MFELSACIKLKYKTGHAKFKLAFPFKRKEQNSEEPLFSDKISHHHMAMAVLMEGFWE